MRSRVRANGEEGVKRYKVVLMYPDDPSVEREESCDGEYALYEEAQAELDALRSENA